MPFDSSDVQSKLKDDISALGYRATGTSAFFSYDSGFKRFFDVTLVLLSAIIVLPVIAIMAVLVSLDGHAPFYTQARVGRGGRIFRLIKIRTMVHNAEALLHDHLQNNPDLKAEWDATQKLKQDPRITPIGRLLRRTSMDELPQLLNVLAGSMSLVGPRPMMPEQQALYPGQSYYRLRPGITGFWQISDRNHCDFSDRAIFDVAYARQISLGTDISVLWQTVRVVLKSTGY